MNLNDNYDVDIDNNNQDLLRLSYQKGYRNGYARIAQINRSSLSNKKYNFILICVFVLLILTLYIFGHSKNKKYDNCLLDMTSNYYVCH